MAVPLAANSAAVTANMPAPQIKRSEDYLFISPSHCGQIPKVVCTGGDTRAVGQKDREDWPVNCMTGGLTRLASEAAALQTFCAGFRANRTIGGFKHFEGAERGVVSGWIVN